MTAVATITNSPAIVLGGLTVAFAVAFNVPFSILASIFEYPDVLRLPAGEVLTRFNTGGAPLILTWHSFALVAFALVPLSIALSLGGDRLQAHPLLAIGAAVVGSMAGLSQAIGLWRWVFVVPSLARAYVDPSLTEAAHQSAADTFAVLNLYGGVAIGEHIGQLMTALFALMLSLIHMKEGNRITAWLGLVTAAAIAIGTNEGLAIALGKSGETFGLITVAGFLLLSLWLALTGLGLLRKTV